MPVHPNLLKSAKKLLQSSHRFADDVFLGSLHTLSDDDLDQLNFGVIGLTDNGTILRYNAYETELANREKTTTIGKSFFEEVAPCTNVPIFFRSFFRWSTKRRSSCIRQLFF